jgi:hypothetical protein
MNALIRSAVKCKPLSGSLRYVDVMHIKRVLLMILQFLELFHHINKKFYLVEKVMLQK